MQPPASACPRTGSIGTAPLHVPSAPGPPKVSFNRTLSRPPSWHLAGYLIDRARGALLKLLREPLKIVYRRTEIDVRRHEGAASAKKYTAVGVPYFQLTVLK